MKRSLYLLLALIIASSTAIYCQSLESQLAIFFGEVMSESQKREWQTLGKGISAVGEYRSDLERTQAENTKTYNYNINTNQVYQGSDGRYYPQTGYAWNNPNSVNDFSVVRLPTPATLPPYDMYQLEKSFFPRQSSSNAFWRGANNHPTQLGSIITYNFYYDLNNDGLMTINEFHGVKRTFNFGEEVSLAWTYFQNNPESGLSITWSVYLVDLSTGKEIASETWTEPLTRGSDFGNRVRYSGAGTKIPPGKYLVGINLSQSRKGNKKSWVSSLSEQFEVLPPLNRSENTSLPDVFEKQQTNSPKTANNFDKPSPCPPDYCEVLEDVPLRREPGIEAEKIMTIVAGSCVKLKDAVNEGRYFLVEYKGLSGYVFHEALDIK